MTGKCFHCQQSGHRRSECPLLRGQGGGAPAGQQGNQNPPQQKAIIPAAQPAGGNATRPQQQQQQKAGPGRKPGGNNQRAGGRVFALQGEEEPDFEDPAMIRGILTLFNSWVLVLFDTGASHSFISTSCVNALGLDTEPLDTAMSVGSPLGGKVRIDKICKSCKLEFAGYRLLCDLRVIDMAEFDVILGMDWLTTNR